VYDPNERLQRLWLDWRHCRKCELSNRRIDGNFPIVFGEGALRGILFIGEGPGKEEERDGVPFVGNSGKMLRTALCKLGLKHVCYTTNTVCCRSCGYELGPDGAPMGYTRNGVFTPRIRDRPPKVENMQACLPRLYEQIYLVDPILIVCLGAESSKLLARKSVSITTESGVLRVVSIPGHAYVPQLTDKKKEWARKQAGVLVAPIELNQVQYLMMPLIHPSYALRKSADMRMGNPLEKFVQCMKLLGGFYRNYIYEMTGEVIPQEDLTTEELISAGDE
jgi:uracil-DNA glycosylase